MQAVPMKAPPSCSCQTGGGILPMSTALPALTFSKSGPPLTSPGLWGGAMAPGLVLLAISAYRAVAQAVVALGMRTGWVRGRQVLGQLFSPFGAPLPTLRRYPKTSSAAVRAGRPRSQQGSIDRLRDRLAARNRVGIAAEVAGAQRLFPKHALDRVHDGAPGALLAKVVEHHGARPDLADGIGDALAGNVGRGAVNRLEHGRELAVRIDVAARRDADGSGAGRAQGRQGNPPQVGPDHGLETGRLTDG